MGDNDAPSRPSPCPALCSALFSALLSISSLACARDHHGVKNRVLPKPRQATLDELQACDGPLLLSTTTLLFFFSTAASAVLISANTDKLINQSIDCLIF